MLFGTPQLTKYCAFDRHDCVSQVSQGMLISTDTHQTTPRAHYIVCSYTPDGAYFYTTFRLEIVQFFQCYSTHLRDCVKSSTKDNKPTICTKITPSCPMVSGVRGKGDDSKEDWDVRALWQLEKGDLIRSTKASPSTFVFLDTTFHLSRVKPTNSPSARLKEKGRKSKHRGPTMVHDAYENRCSLLVYLRVSALQ